jgi:iron complex outermembrane receptor protein/hemoglobin/transferrin/lactoferrin receptor protein
MKHKTLRSLLTAAIILESLHANTLQLDTISVTASPIHDHDTFDIPAQVDILTKEHINSQSTASLGSILEDTPGVNNLSTGSQAGKPIIRGMSGERVKILSNGAATDFQTYGIRHISNTDPFLADRIEVIRGAQGVLYGSDALGGVVNILSPELLYAKEGESKLKGEVLGEYHTNNDERSRGVKLQAASGKLGVTVGVIKRKSGNLHTPNSDTWSQGEPSGDLPRFAGELPYSNYESTSAQVAIGYTDNWGNVALQHTYWQSFQNYLGHGSAPAYNPLASAGQDLSNNETQLKGEFLSGEWIIKPSLSRTLNRRQAATNVPYESMNNSNIDLDIEVDRLDGKLALVHPPIGAFEGEIGIEGYDKEQSVRDGHLVPNADESGKSIYLFEEADSDRWIFQWGLRYDTRKVDAKVTTGGDKTFSAFGGSVGATYKLTDTWNIAANLSRGFRAPSIFELYADGTHGGVQAYQIGNPNLREETTLGGDLSLRYKDDRTKASLTLYRTYINDYIYLANTGIRRNPTTGAIVAMGGVPEMTNQQSDAIMEGIEFLLETHLSDATRFEGSFEIINGKDTGNNRDLTMMPSNNLHLALYHNLGALGNFKNNTFSVNMKAYDDQQVAGTYEPFAQYNTMPFGSADTAGYTLWGIGYESSISLMNHNANLGIKVDNLFDTKYRDFLDTYKGYTLGMGRNISFSLRIPF